MIRKTWHKQRHRRKIWNSYTIVDKIWYYMKPFLLHLILVWLQPLPVPTILKVLYSMCLLVFILFPIIYPTTTFLASFWVFQYIVERHFDVEFRDGFNLRGYVHKLINVDPTGEYRQAVYFHVEHFKIMLATFVSLIDYIRLATGVIFGI